MGKLLGVLAGSTFAVGALSGLAASQWGAEPADSARPPATLDPTGAPALPQPLALNGRPQLNPLPPPEDIWECQVVVVGGSLGGVAAAAHAMAGGAQTCLIEVSPWLGGQISSQGVSAIDESLAMRQRGNFSPSWQVFRRRIEQQLVELPPGGPIQDPVAVSAINSCWVGTLCFPPVAGAQAAEAHLQEAAAAAPNSRWGTSIAFKGARFDATGQRITAIHAVQRIPRYPDYQPQGRLSQELAEWYSWSPTDTFDRVPIELRAPAGEQLIVIDATDTGELVGWARVPYRVGSEAKATLGEPNGADFDNPDCTQAFTYPFALALQDDNGDSLAALSRLEPTFGLHEHRSTYGMEGFPMFQGKSLFHYRRIVSHSRNDPYFGAPAVGDISMINWNQGNDWNWMNPPLVMAPDALAEGGQYQNWMGGLSPEALKFAEEHALMFARWLMEEQATAAYPLTYLYGPDSPMGTLSGLSMTPYIREGRRILGRPAYGQESLMILENDLRRNLPQTRRFDPTAVGVIHYAIDIHGCRYRNWQPSGDAVSAPAQEPRVRPLILPLESLIPQGIDNLLIGGKSLAVSHIANASTRVHYGEWHIGAAAGTTAAWLSRGDAPAVTPATLVAAGYMPELQRYMGIHGLRLSW